MSAEIPPDPVSDTFNPSAWNVPAFTDEERALLDANYIKFPIAQNSPISFPSSITAPTQDDTDYSTNVATTAWGNLFWTYILTQINTFTGTQTFTNTCIVATQLNTDDSTFVATTAWGNLFWNYVRSIANTWTGTQTFSGTITSTVIAPTTSGGTLNIGNAAGNAIFVAGTASRTAILNIGNGNSSAGGINIGNGLLSSNPVNILYSSTDAGASGEINLGSATGTVNLRCPLTPIYSYPIATGKIGEVVTYAGSVTPITYTTNVPLELMSMTGFTVGTWLMTATASRTNGNNTVYLSIALSTDTADVTSVNALGVEYSIGTSVGTSNNNSLSAIVQVTSSATVYYINGQTNTGGSGTTITPGKFRAVRLA